jgi:hypothetical protein
VDSSCGVWVLRRGALRRRADDAARAAGAAMRRRAFDRSPPCLVQVERRVTLPAFAAPLAPSTRRRLSSCAAVAPRGSLWPSCGVAAPPEQAARVHPCCVTGAPRRVAVRGRFRCWPFVQRPSVAASPCRRRVAHRVQLGARCGRRELWMRASSSCVARAVGPPVGCSIRPRALCITRRRVQRAHPTTASRPCRGGALRCRSVVNQLAARRHDVAEPGSYGPVAIFASGLLSGWKCGT